MLAVGVVREETVVSCWGCEGGCSMLPAVTVHHEMSGNVPSLLSK